MTRSIFSKLLFMKSFQIFFSISMIGFSTMLFLALSHSPMASLTLSSNFETSVCADLISFRVSLDESSHCLLLSVKNVHDQNYVSTHFGIIIICIFYLVFVIGTLLTCDTNPWQNLLQQNSDLISCLLPFCIFWIECPFVGLAIFIQFFKQILEIIICDHAWIEIYKIQI